MIFKWFIWWFIATVRIKEISCWLIDLQRLESMMLQLSCRLKLLESLRLTASALSFRPFQYFKVVLSTKHPLILYFSRSSVLTQIRFIVSALLSSSLFLSVRQNHASRSMLLQHHLIAWSLTHRNGREILLLLGCNNSIVQWISFAIIRRLFEYRWAWYW